MSESLERDRERGRGGGGGGRERERKRKDRADSRLPPPILTLGERRHESTTGAVDVEANLRAEPSVGGAYSSIKGGDVIVAARVCGV